MVRMRLKTAYNSVSLGKVQGKVDRTYIYSV